MDRKSHPFSSLTEADLDAIIDRAQRARAETIAAGFIWLGRLLRVLLVAPIARLWSAAQRSVPPRDALHH
jgi:hypothetical protein